ncbi:MAG TPA: hypothetical protein PK992_17285, partial [Planctomycetaceae bacterium]|nr:hypothetical protein [Planctomycetaceae bacterium]
VRLVPSRIPSVGRHLCGSSHPTTSPAKAESTVRTMFFLPFQPKMPGLAVLQMANIVEKSRGRLCFTFGGRTCYTTL